jgi:fucose 4-O-acetylase-like acetyltransferase
MLILSVFVFHVGMFFNSFGWHIKNNELITGLDAPMAFLHLWRMPLLFLISGAGTYFALGKRKLGGFVSERSYRLLIPLVFGMFVIVPPQVFIEKIAQYGNYINFLPHLAEGSYPTGNFSWHHLWFLLYLFVCWMMAIPVILLLRFGIGCRIYAFTNRIFRIK